MAMGKTNEAAAALSSGQGVDNSPYEILCTDVARTLGHALRVLAAECTSLCRDRRQLCLDTLQEGNGRQAMEAAAVIYTAF
jgi:hypothetical protein